MPRIWGLIPARLDSRRLPRKPLLDLAGSPLIWRTYLAAKACEKFSVVKVVTDNHEIEQAICERGGEAVFDPNLYLSGTARIAAEARRAFQNHQLSAEDLVLNIQGDEPFLNPEDLGKVISKLLSGAEIATLSAPISGSDMQNPSFVKVVCDHKDQALYFSRAAVPGRLHVGVYGFKVKTLLEIAELPGSELASAENLEQLDWLYAGYEIAVAQTDHFSFGINTPEDLELARLKWAELQSREGKTS